MLDTRYIHLHEALGLGAMWLKNTAKVIGQTSVSGSLKTHSPQKSARTARQDNAAHQQMVAWLKQNTPANHDLPTKSAPPQPTQFELPAMFSGSIPLAKVLVLSLEASPNDFVLQQLFSGEEGELLHKMLAAIKLSPNDVHLSCWLKTQRPLAMPSRAEIVQAAELVRQEWQQTQAKTMLLLGEIFYRADLHTQIRQITGETPVFVIPHPHKILADKSLKRPAWETLQQLQTYLQQ